MTPESQKEVYVAMEKKNGKGPMGVGKLSDTTDDELVDALRQGFRITFIKVKGWGQAILEAATPNPKENKKG